MLFVMPLRGKQTPDRREAATHEELVVRIAEDKGRPRFRRTPLGTEKPRAVFLESVGKIVRQIEEIGFRYAPSGPQATRHTGNTIQKVRFRSSPRNVPGELVVLSMVLEIRDLSLETWRKTESLPWSSSVPVWRRGVGQLLEPPVALDWNLADMRRRPATVEDAAATLLQNGLPSLDRITRVLSGSAPRLDVLAGLLEPGISVEYQLRAGHLEDAGAIVSSIFGVSLDMLETLEDRIERVKAEPIPRYDADLYRIPFLVAKYDLPVRRL
jgi:hypothetical protein